MSQLNPADHRRQTIFAYTELIAPKIASRLPDIEAKKKAAGSGQVAA
jgi:hypothetical protein